MRTFVLGVALCSVACSVASSPTSPASAAAPLTGIRLIATPASVLTGGSSVVLQAALQPPRAGVHVRFGVSNGASMGASDQITDTAGTARVSATSDHSFDASAAADGLPNATMTIAAVDPFTVTVQGISQSGGIGNELYLGQPPLGGGPTPPVQWGGSVLIVSNGITITPTVVHVSCGDRLPATSDPIDIRPGVLGTIGIGCAFRVSGTYPVAVTATAPNGFIARGSVAVIIRPPAGS